MQSGEIMRLDGTSGIPLEEFTKLLEAAAHEQGFVLVDGPRVFANDNQDCGCPPGVCLGKQAEEEEQEVDPDFEMMMSSIAQAMQQDQGQDEVIQAIAQLGRIVEGLTILANLHADLLKAALED
jgi:hypothetical protein